MPIFDFQTPQAIVPVEDKEIGIAPLFAICRGDVVPDQIFIIEVFAQEIGKAPFTNLHVFFSERGNYLRHGNILMLINGIIFA